MIPRETEEEKNREMQRWQNEVRVKDRRTLRERNKRGEEGKKDDLPLRSKMSLDHKFSRAG